MAPEDDEIRRRVFAAIDEIRRRQIAEEDAEELAAAVEALVAEWPALSDTTIEEVRRYLYGRPPE